MERRSGAGQNKPLNVEYIQEKVDEGYKYTEKATGRDLMLIIGNTGVGKTTICHYLSGHQMNKRPVIETVQEAGMQIGHNVYAETFYAQSILLNIGSQIQSGNISSNVCLIDCPGFLENKTGEDNVIQLISTELAIRSAQEIKGFLILISYSSFRDHRLTEIRQFIKTLISLFKDPVEMVQHSIFIITKKDAHMPDDKARGKIVDALSCLISHCQDQAIRIFKNPHFTPSEDLTYNEYNKIATYFSAVLKKENDIIFFNPSDSGESGKLIFEQIIGIKPKKGYWEKLIDASKKKVGLDINPTTRPINVDDFNFSQYDAHRIEFNKALYHRAYDGRQLIAEICACNEMDRSLALKISDYQARVASLEKLVSNLKEDKTNIGKGDNANTIENSDSIAILESIIVGNDEDITLKQSKLNAIEALEEKLCKELENIDTDDPLVFTEKSIFKDDSLWKLLDREEMKFSVNTADEAIPIIQVDKAMENGDWYDEVDDRDKGFYAVTYKSDYRARPARASVKAYIKTKHDNGNKIRIEQIKDKRKSQAKKKTMIESEIIDLNRKNKALQFTVKQTKISKEAYENNLKQSLIEYEEEKEYRYVQISKMQQDRKQARVVGLQKLKEFNENQPKFEILVNIAGFLKFSSPFIQSFISQYKKFLSKREGYNVGESSDIPDSSASKVENKQNLNLKDPITGNVIRNLVVTSAGTLFDESSLLKQFEDSKEDFAFTRKDGRFEVIKYLTWKKIPDVQIYLDGQQRGKFSPLSSSTPSFIQSDIIGMDDGQLAIQRDIVLQEIEVINAQMEIKRIELDKIYRRLEDMKPKTESEDMLSVTVKDQVPNSRTMNGKVACSSSSIVEHPYPISSAELSTNSMTNGAIVEDSQTTVKQIDDLFYV